MTCVHASRTHTEHLTHHTMCVSNTKPQHAACPEPSMIYSAHAPCTCITHTRQAYQPPYLHAANSRQLSRQRPPAPPLPLPPYHGPRALSPQHLRCAHPPPWLHSWPSHHPPRQRSPPSPGPPPTCAARPTPLQPWAGEAARPARQGPRLWPVDAAVRRFYLPYDRLYCSPYSAQRSR